MGTSAELARFELLLATLDDLREENAVKPIVVEGPRDVAALRDLGCAGAVIPLNQGVSLFEVGENLSEGASDVIVLTDWDRKGTRLIEDVTRILAANGTRVDASFRDRIRAGVAGDLKDVESLFGYVARRVHRYYGVSLDEYRRGLGNADA